MVESSLPVFKKKQQPLIPSGYNKEALQNVGQGLSMQYELSEDETPQNMHKNQSEVAIVKELGVIGGSHEFRTLAKNDSLEQFRYINTTVGGAAGEKPNVAHYRKNLSIGQTVDTQDRTSQPIASNESNQRLVSIEHYTSVDEDDKFTTDMTKKKQAFFSAYTSHLRVQSHVDGLFRLKRDLKLPEIALNTANIVDPSNGLSERRQKKLQTDKNFIGNHIGNQLKQLSRHRKQSVPFLDKLELEGDKAGPLTSRKGLGRKNEKYKDILNEIASTRSLMLANTPHRQMEISLTKVDRSARRLSNRSMVMGSNAQILERRYSEMRNSPSGSYLVHPKSSIPDGHPTDFINMMRVQDKKRQDNTNNNPTNALYNVLQSGSYLIDAAEEAAKQQQLQFAAENEQMLTFHDQQTSPFKQQSSTSRNNENQESTLSNRLQVAQMAERGYPKPSFSDQFQQAIDRVHDEHNLASRQSELERRAEMINIEDSDKNRVEDSQSKNEHLFKKMKPANITNIRSPLLSQRQQTDDMTQQSPLQSKVELAKRRNSVQLPELLTTPQATSKRSIFGTKRRSETVGTRNQLAKIISQTTPGPNISKGSLLLASASQSSINMQLSAAKKAPLRALLDPNEKKMSLDKQRIAAQFTQLLASQKTSIVTQQVNAKYERRLSEIHQRNLPPKKLKLYSPIKKPRPPHEEEDKYEWVLETPYETNQAIDALDDQDPLGGQKQEHMALLKAFKKKMENSDNHFQQAFSQHSQHLGQIIKVLDLQQSFQKEANNPLGFKKYQIIKELYKKHLEQQKISIKQKKIAEKIAGEGTTTVAHSRTDMVSERVETAFTRQTTMEPNSPVNVHLPGQKSTTPLEATFQINVAQGIDDMVPRGEIKTELSMMRTFFRQKGATSNMILHADDNAAQDASDERVSAGSQRHEVQQKPLEEATFTFEQHESIFNSTTEDIHKGKETSKDETKITADLNDRIIENAILVVQNAKLESESVTQKSLQKDRQVTDNEKEEVDDEKVDEKSEKVDSDLPIADDNQGPRELQAKAIAAIDLIKEESIKEISIVNEAVESEKEDILDEKKVVKDAAETEEKASERAQSPNEETKQVEVEKQNEQEQDDEYDDEVWSEKSKPISKGTIGVHDLAINESLLNAPMVEREGRFLALKDDIAKAAGEKLDPRKAYNLDDYFVRNFIDACQPESNNEDGPQINPYPLLHQIRRQNFVLKGQDLPEEMLVMVVKRAVAPVNAGLGGLKYTFKLFYLEDFKISDTSLAKIVKLLTMMETLQRVVLVKMELGPATTSALVYLNKKMTQTDKGADSFAIDLRECQLVNLAEPLIEKEIFTHPMLKAGSPSPIRRLTLVNQALVDGHLGLINEKKLELLDLSHNRFTPDGLNGFIHRIIQHPTHKMSLRSLSVAGNSLDGVEYERTLCENLSGLICQSYLQHLDLSLTQLKPDTTLACMKVLLQAQSIQSLHLSSANIQWLVRKAQKIFKSCLYNELAGIASHQELSHTWNEDYNYPHVEEDDIGGELSSSIVGVNCREHAARKQSAQQSYDQQRFVLSRLMGRKDITNKFDWLRHDEASDNIDAQVDIRKDLPEELLREVELGRRTPEDLCWVMSQECWICELWSYYMPIISRQEITGVEDGESQKLKPLTKSQNRIFEKIVEKEAIDYENLEYSIPYIIGVSTRFKFIRLEPFQDIMNSIDLNGAKIKTKTRGNPEQLFNHYRLNWAKVIELSSQKETEEQGGSPRKGKHVGSEQSGLLYPYKPYTDKGLQQVFSEYDVLWTIPLLCKPGQQDFFLVYKFDSDRIIKAHYKSNIPIRHDQIGHHHILPKMRRKETTEEKEARRDKNYYFDVFRTYTKKLSHQALVKVMQSDFEHWDSRSIPQLQIVGKQGYISLTKVFSKHVEELFVIFKRLQSTSDEFPLLSFFCVNNWAKQIGIISDGFTEDTFSKLFGELKQEDSKSAVSTNSRRNSMLRRSSSMILKQSLQTGGKKANKQEGEDGVPKNALARHHFFELVVRIAIDKFGMQSSQIKPEVAVEMLIKGVILPSFQENKMFMNPGETRTWIEGELLLNRDAQKFLFLNQFSLKKIFDKICHEGNQSDDAPIKEAASLKRKGTRRASVKRRATKIEAIAEEPESFSASPKTTMGKKPLILDPSSPQSNFDDIQSPIFSPTPRTGKFSASPKSGLINKSLKLIQEDYDFQTAAAPFINRQDTKEYSTTEYNEDINGSQGTSFYQETLARNTKSTEIEQDQNSKSISIRLGDTMQDSGTLKDASYRDTVGTIGLRDTKMQSGSTAFVQQSALKGTKKSVRKPAHITIQPQFLPKRQRMDTISSDRIMITIQQAFPEDFKKLASQQVHQHCFTWAKLPGLTLGNNVKDMEASKDASQRVNFLEFVVYLCVLGQEINKLEMVAGAAKKESTEVIGYVLNYFLPFYQHTVHEVPEDDTRGLAEYAQDILVQGRVQKYDNQNDVSSVSSNEVDFYSDQDSNSDDGRRKKKEKKIYLDKWELTAKENAKRKLPQPRPKIPLDRPNYEAIDAMMEARQERKRLEEAKQRQLDKGLRDNQSEEEQ